MYLAAMIFLMAVLPGISIAAEALSGSGTALPLLVGKWTVFWSLGAKLLCDGICRLAPHAPVTSEASTIGIWNRSGADVLIGAACVVAGAAGISTLGDHAGLIPAAASGLLLYCISAARQLGNSEHEWIGDSLAWLDFCVAAAFAIYVAYALQQ
jgi:hypothetical protein